MVIWFLPNTQKKSPDDHSWNQKLFFSKEKKKEPQEKRKPRNGFTWENEKLSDFGIAQEGCSVQRSALLRILHRQIIWVTFRAGCNAASARGSSNSLHHSKDSQTLQLDLFLFIRWADRIYHYSITIVIVAIEQRFFDYNESQDTTTEATVLHLKSGV